MAKYKRKPEHDFVSFAYRINSLPRPLPRIEVLTTLIKSAESGSGKLPAGWDITWSWRNKRNGEIREDTFAGAVTKSRASFLKLMGIRLRRDLATIAPDVVVPYEEPREASEVEAEAIEEEREEREEEQATEEAKRKRKKRRAAKRKNANKKHRRARS
jgi:hypothetical protein